MDIYNFEDRKKDDTSALVRFTVKDKKTLLPINITGATIKCQFRYGTKKGELIADLAIGTGITVEDAAGGILVIDAIDPLTWSGGTYYYDIEITFTDGRVKTYIGGTIKVIDTVTV